MNLTNNATKRQNRTLFDYKKAAINFNLSLRLVKEIYDQRPENIRDSIGVNNPAIKFNFLESCHYF